MLDTLIEFDRELFLAVNAFRHEALDPAVFFLSRHVWVWIPLYALIVVGMIRRFGWKAGAILIVGAAVAVGLSDYVCASLIRPGVGRLRPSHPLSPVASMVNLVDGYRAGRYTFPSCHGANCFCVAVFTSLTFKKGWITAAMLIWAVFMCWTRLYLGVHYPADLAAGATIGSLMAWGIYSLCKRINMRKFIGAAIIVLFAPLAAQAQEQPKFAWGVDFLTVFDNREGTQKYSPSETYFLTRLSPEIGLTIDGGVHSLMGGVAYVQPIGAEWDGHKISPTLYYRYRKSQTGFAFGMIPRRLLSHRLPNYLLSDSAGYWQANVRGAMLTLDRPAGYFQALIDWRGMQSETRREAFSIIAMGEWHNASKLLLAGGTGMMNHLARRKDAPESEFVVDNLLAHAWIGTDLASVAAPMKELSLRVGPITSLTRDRADHDWIAPIGAFAELKAEWWRLSLHNSLYLGNKPLFPLHGRYGCLLNEGENYFASKFYNRLDLRGRLITYRSNLTLDASLDFHFAQSSFSFYQCLLLRLTI